jgi:hypothetical protein
VAKTFQIGRDQRINFEALFINAFNQRNTTVGGPAAPRSASTRRRSVRYGRHRQRPASAVQAEIYYFWGV